MAAFSPARGKEKTRAPQVSVRWVHLDARNFDEGDVDCLSGGQRDQWEGVGMGWGWGLCFQCVRVCTASYRPKGVDGVMRVSA